MEGPGSRGRSLLNGDPGLPQTPAWRENSQLERREKMEGAGFSICIKAGALRLPPFMSCERLGFPGGEAGVLC